MLSAIEKENKRHTADVTNKPMRLSIKESLLNQK
jgi:hypothetical protein